MLAKDACPRACAICGGTQAAALRRTCSYLVTSYQYTTRGYDITLLCPADGCHLAYGANLKSLAQNGNFQQFDGITKYLSEIPSKVWDVNRLCGDFFEAFSKSETALCGKPFDVSKIGTQRIVKTVTVQCGQKMDLYVLVSCAMHRCRLF